jgi:hypothetical protein
VKYGHVESKYIKNMEALASTMKKHNINISSSSSSHGHALSSSSFSFNTTSTSSSDEWFIDSGAYFCCFRKYSHKRMKCQAFENIHWHPINLSF